MPIFSRSSQETSMPRPHQVLDHGCDPRVFECLNASILPPLPLAASTPPLPEKGRKAHRNQLQCFFDDSRRLRSMFIFSQNLFPKLAISFCEDMQPPDTRHYFTRRPSYIYNPSLSVPLPPEASTVSHVSDYAYHYTLQPVARALQAAHPTFASHRWFSAANTGHPDDALMKTLYWRGPTSRSGVASTNMIAFVQAPWVLAERDFRNFIRARSMPQAQRQLTGKERLWAKIYDECVRTNCRWFVVTTYYQWTFGVFSEAFNAATVTVETPSTKSCTPRAHASPFQSLFYWLGSSLSIPGTHVPDEFMESTLDPLPTHKVKPFMNEWTIFQASDSELSSDEEGEQMKSQLPQAEASFATLTVHGRKNPDLSTRLPLPGDMFTKAAVLPKRQSATRRVAALDWLDSQDYSYMGNERAVQTSVRMERQGETSAYGVGSRDEAEEVPPSPTESEQSSTGSVIGTKVGQSIGKAMFAVAPQKRVYRHYKV